MLEEDIFDLTPQEFFDTVGNDIDFWYLKSLALLASAEAVESICGRTPSEPKSEEKVAKWMDMHEVFRMLCGMALECMFKSLWLKQGGVLAKKGRYRSIPGTRDHDLGSLEGRISEKVDTGLDAEEKKLLARLSFFIVYGRYPINKSISTYPSSPCNDEPIRWCKWGSKDYRMLNELTDKLINLIENES